MAPIPVSTTPLTLLQINAQLKTAVLGYEGLMWDAATKLPDIIGKFLVRDDKRYLKGDTGLMAGLSKAGRYDGNSDVFPKVESANLGELHYAHMHYAMELKETWETLKWDMMGVAARLKNEETFMSMWHERADLFADYITWMFDHTTAGLPPEFGVYPLGTDFFATDHPVYGGGVQSNLYTAGGSHVRKLVGMCALLREQKDYFGRPINQVPAKLYFHSGRKEEFEQYFNRGLNWEYGNANHNANPLSGDIELVPMWNMPDPDWVILQGSGRGGYYSEPQKPDVHWEMYKGRHMELNAIGSISFCVERYQNYVACVSL